MNDIEAIVEFRRLIVQFKENQKRFALAIVNGDFKDPVFENIYKVVTEIKEKLAQYDVLRVDDLTLKNDLIAIRENKDFAYFEILEILSKYDDRGGVNKFTFSPNWEEFYRSRWDDILQNELLSQVDPHTLITRKMDLGTLLVGKTVPEHLRTHLRQIKECYAWGFKTEASIYCRTILEEGFREALKSKPEFSNPEQRRDLEGWSLDWLLNHSKKKRYFYAEVIKRAYKLKENVNHIVHPTSARKPDVKMSDLEIIKDTFYILEMLFR
jgi:hypothetical protein